MREWMKEFFGAWGLASVVWAGHALWQGSGRAAFFTPTPGQAERDFGESLE